MAMREHTTERSESQVFYWETAVATIWTLVVAIALMLSAYTRLGRSSLDDILPADDVATVLGWSQD
jgi:hypothetical protein